MIWTVGPSEIARLALDGVSMHGSIKKLHMTSRLEPPCIVNAQIAPSHFISIGAFSYTQGGEINLSTIGRYCSFASGLVIGQPTHPTSWLSTSTFQYREDPWGFGTFGVKADVTKDLPKRELGFVTGNPTTIGNDVWIGSRAVLMQGIKVGDGAIIGAGAVVTKDVEPYAIVGGVPAKVIRFRFTEEQIARFLTFRWWRFPLWEMRDVPFNDPDRALELLERKAETMKEWRPSMVKLG